MCNRFASNLRGSRPLFARWGEGRPRRTRLLHDLRSDFAASQFMRQPCDTLREATILRFRRIISRVGSDPQLAGTAAEPGLCVGMAPARAAMNGGLIVRFWHSTLSRSSSLGSGSRSAARDAQPMAHASCLAAVFHRTPERRFAADDRRQPMPYGAIIGSISGATRPLC